MKNKNNTPEAIDKMRKALMKRVLNINTNEIYESRLAAAKANNVTAPTMGKWIKLELNFKYIK